MVVGRVSVVGLRELNSALRKAPGAIEFGMKDAHKNAADIVFQAALPKTPVDTGALKASMRVLASKRRGAVAAGNRRKGVFKSGKANPNAVPYAGPVHWGWPARNIRPQPWIWDTLTKKRQEVEVQFMLDLNKIIAKAFLVSSSKVFSSK